jgi:hypothetical protein
VLGGLRLNSRRSGSPGCILQKGVLQSDLCLFFNSDKQRLGNLTISYMCFRLWSFLTQMFKFVPIQCVENESLCPSEGDCNGQRSG